MNSDLRNYEILYDQPTGDYEQKAVSGIRTKTIRAGRSLEVEVYPIIKRWSESASRELQRRKTGRAQQEVNLRNSRKRIRRMMETNFTEDDFFLTLTYDYGFVDAGFMDRTALRMEYERNAYPMDDAQARRCIVNYIHRIKRMLASVRPGAELKYIYVIESTKEPRDTDPDPLPPRYHYHLIVSAPGLTREDLEGKWTAGSGQTRRLEQRWNGFDGLAAYISKQRSFARRWACSRNLKKPEERISDRAISRHRAARIAADVQAYGKEIFERLYPEYSCVELPVVKYSDFAAGAYIYARMKRRGSGNAEGKSKKLRAVRH